MHPSLIELVARQHIEELHREAELQRLVRNDLRKRSNRPKAPEMTLRRAPAH